MLGAGADVQLARLMRTRTLKLCGPSYKQMDKNDKTYLYDPWFYNELQ